VKNSAPAVFCQAY